MSSTIESTSTWTFHPEMERGYEGSPMACLISQYKASSDDNISTYQRVANLASKKSLFDSEIIGLEGSQRGYTILPQLMRDVKQVVNELQVFLERTSTLIPEQSSFFKVDPRDTFLPILRQSSDISQIHAAWMGLTKWLSLAQRNISKYKLQYRNPLPGENIMMPNSSTLPSLGYSIWNPWNGGWRLMDSMWIPWTGWWIPWTFQMDSMEFPDHSMEFPDGFRTV